jgi:hypothetical protein
MNVRPQRDRDATFPANVFHRPVGHRVRQQRTRQTAPTFMHRRVDTWQDTHQLVQGPNREPQFRRLLIGRLDHEHESVATWQDVHLAEFKLIGW